MTHDFRTSRILNGSRGAKRVVKQAAATLTRDDSDAVCLFNAAAGFTYTLPPAEVGLTFEFLVTVTVTSSAAKIVTNSTSEFIVGAFIQSTDGTYTTAAHAANGTTHRSWNGNGSTTGGLIGDWVRLTAISSTQWAIVGFGRATGTEATPFATS